ncbi:MAG: glycoside hydrolase family 3 C-terminal domain-containing protein [Melioribacteraceae bacterium]|nr:glycoside hydrolase family 3 C-terminal domain-containing protein [Melioribacteraceae bacterium]
MRKNILLILLFFILLLVNVVNGEENSENKYKEADDFVRILLSKMTLEEKIGQMNQITVEVISKPRADGFQKLEIDPDKLKEALVKYHTGSIINTGGYANNVDNWHEIITVIQDGAAGYTRLGIPVLYGIDAIHGVSYTRGATLFPQSVAMAASRNRELLRQSAEITALEMRASGIPWTFNPVLGMGREPYWSRLWETFGEDVYLASEFGREYVKGIQGSDPSDKINAAACMKHYLGYSVPKNGRDRTPAWIPERMLREIFLPSFKAAVDAGVLTAMANSSEINGIPVHSDYYLLTELLKDELGFKGFMVSDWEDIKRLYERDHVAGSPREAVKMAVMAGIDMSMVPFDFSFYELLLELVKDGEVPVERIDDAVTRILRVKYLLGLFDNAYPDKSLLPEFASQKNTGVNLQAARESITMLKNDNSVLPLSKEKKYLVTGPASNMLSVLNGGWSITWQGNEEKLYPEDKYTILEAVQSKAGNENVIHMEGCTFEEDINTKETVSKASEADAVIVCIGEPPYCEGEGNINNLEMTSVQLELAAQLSKTGKPVILVLVEGRPRVISKIADDASAILMAYLPGMEGGRAIADILFGDANPSGKLPFSYPRDVRGNTCYDFKPIEQFDVNKYNPQWEFGYGLSYTNFEYANLVLDKTEYKMNDVIRVSVDLKNTGSVDGKETVELYICDIVGTVSRPVRQLKRFQKINLEAGKSTTVSFELDMYDLSFINRDNLRTTEPGEFTVMVKNLEKKFVLADE